jgi:hypothetical protein
LRSNLQHGQLARGVLQLVRVHLGHVFRRRVASRNIRRQAGHHLEDSLAHHRALAGRLELLDHLERELVDAAEVVDDRVQELGRVERRIDVHERTEDAVGQELLDLLDLLRFHPHRFRH